MDLKKKMGGSVNWMGLAEFRDRRQELVNRIKTVEE